MILMLNKVALVDARHLLMMMCRSRFPLNSSRRLLSPSLAHSHKPTLSPHLSRSPPLSRNRRHQRTSLSKAGTRRCRTITIPTRLVLGDSTDHLTDLATECRNMGHTRRTLHIPPADSSRHSRRCSSLLTQATRLLRQRRDRTLLRATRTRICMDMVSGLGWVGLQNCQG